MFLRGNHPARRLLFPVWRRYDPVANHGVREGANSDLIVMGTNGRGAVAPLLVGLVAERVVRTARCPVLTVRRPEHEFVVPDAARERRTQA